MIYNSYDLRFKPTLRTLTMAYYPEHPESSRTPPLPPPPSNAGFYRAFFILVLLVIALAMPYFVEQISFSYTRGKQRAEAEVAGQQLAALPESTSVYRIVVKAVAPSVVGVVVAKRGREEVDEFSQLFGAGRPQAESLGSGVIVDTAGYIVTNNHVVDNAQSIMVKLSDGRSVNQCRIGGRGSADGHRRAEDQCWRSDCRQVGRQRPGRGGRSGPGRRQTPTA